ncbi:MAG: SxtJ family membrane protein [Gemmatimonadota bacterium]
MSEYILGISAFYHDAAACLLRDGAIVAAAQEERFSRTKHDPGFPGRAIEFCLAEGGIGAEEVACVAYYDKPWLKFERILETSMAYAPRGLRSFLAAMPVWLKEKLWIQDRLRRLVGPGVPLVFPEHHQSHAASAFFPSPFEEAAILTLDGVGEWATTTWGVGRGDRIALREEIHFPHSLGLLYSAFTAYLGFKVNDGEYKVMGLAPYGEPRYVSAILDHLLEVRPDASFRLNMEYFDFARALRMTSEGFHDLFGGPPRRGGEPLTRRHMDVARSIQEVTTRVVLALARRVREETGAANLCMAGGVALNCVANGELLREGVFERLWIQPAAGDAGGAVGAALFAHHHVRGRPREVEAGRDGQRGSRLGPAYTREEVEGWLERHAIPFRRVPGEEVHAATARLLLEEKVVGWFQGRMEFGPRALGGRSILADARSPRMQRILNEKIKGRESFRPFAPACLPEEARRIFDLDVKSPYMLLVARIRAAFGSGAPDEGPGGPTGFARLDHIRSVLPAVTHVDGTARIQTVERAFAPRFHALLERMRDATGFGVVVNTSFNRAGEPIVCTPADAYDCFLGTEMDALVLGDFLLLKEEQPAGMEPLPWDVDAGTIATPAEPPAPRRFGGVMAGAFAALAALGWWKDARAAPYLAGIAALFATAALAAPRVLAPVERVWMALAHRLSRVSTTILLTLVWFLVVTPLALAMRLVGRDPLGVRGARKSYWKEVRADGPASRPEEPY